MNDRITSHNQSGGITGKNVSVGSLDQSNAQGGQHQLNPKHKRARIWKFVLAAMGLIASVLGILQFFGISPWR